MLKEELSFLFVFCYDSFFEAVEIPPLVKVFLFIFSLNLLSTTLALYLIAVALNHMRN
jgi:hypothetical protein